MDVEFSNVSLILLNNVVVVYAVRLPPVAICKSLTIISIIHSNDYPHQLNFKKDVREKEKINLCE